MKLTIRRINLEKCIFKVVKAAVTEELIQIRNFRAN